MDVTISSLAPWLSGRQPVSSSNLAQRAADSFISNNERAFITEALKADSRIDGRNLNDYRKVKFEFSLDDSSASITLGTTRVTAVIDAVLEAPYPDRPNEGSLRINVECSPMASPAFETSRNSPLSVELARLVERAMKQSGAVDTEALCVIAGRKVWSLRCDIHVLDHGGNLIDACVLAALAAFKVFRRPEVSMGGESGTDIIVHPKDQREPLPLTVHHTPLAITWALFQVGEGDVACLPDPSLREEAAQSGSATFIVNTSKEVCGVHKADGVGLTTAQTMRLIQASGVHVEKLVGSLNQALQQHEVARVAARVRRTRGMAGLPAPSRHVHISGQVLKAESTASTGKSVDDLMVSSSSDDEGHDEEEEGSGSGSGDASSSSSDELEEQQHKKSTPGSKAVLVPLKKAIPGKIAAPVARPGSSSVTAGLSPAKPAVVPKLDDNLEAIAALIAGNKGKADADAPVSLSAAVKQDKLKKGKKQAKS